MEISGGGEERETQKRKRRGVELREEEQIGVFHLLFNAFVAFLPWFSRGMCCVSFLALLLTLVLRLEYTS